MCKRKYFYIIALAPIFVTSTAAADAYDAPTGYYDLATGQGAVLKSQLGTIMQYGPDGVAGGGDDHFERRYGDFRYSSALLDADPDQPGNILLVYNRASVPAAWDCPNGQCTWWNREHVWPQAQQPGSANNSTRGNLGDHHALRPANPFINNSRGNKSFGNIDSSGSYGIQINGLWYPGDADAGDIARQMFYSDSRYSSLGIALVNGDVSDYNEPPDGPNPHPNYPYLMGDLASLLLWNYADPPDDFERRRNHLVYSPSANPLYYQRNRNAFVDHPEYVWSIYGGGNNDSFLMVSTTPLPDNSSTTTVNLGHVIAGAPVPAAQAVTLYKGGNDPTYYEVSATGIATAAEEGRYNAFVGGSGIGSVHVGLDTSTATKGLQTGTVTIDNIDITSGGLGQGSADGNDVITVNMTVYDPANASFATGGDQDLLTIDFGTLAMGGAATSGFAIANLYESGGFISDLDLDSVVGSGDTGVLTTDLTPFSGLEAGDFSSFLASFDTTTAGSFNATYTLNLSDMDVPGETTQVLTLQLLGEVTEGVAGDLDGNGIVDLADLALILNNWDEQPPDIPEADPDGNGIVDLADLSYVLNNWDNGSPASGVVGAIPEPTTAVLLGLAGLALIRRPRSA